MLRGVVSTRQRRPVPTEWPPLEAIVTTPISIFDKTRNHKRWVRVRGRDVDEAFLEPFEAPSCPAVGAPRLLRSAPDQAVLQFEYCCMQPQLGCDQYLLNLPMPPRSSRIARFSQLYPTSTLLYATMTTFLLGFKFLNRRLRAHWKRWLSACAVIALVACASLELGRAQSGHSLRLMEGTWQAIEVFASRTPSSR